MEFYTVDVKSITSDFPDSNFVDDDLNTLANLIIESGGILKPLVLKTIGLETYKVVDGHFEYYAAVRAREKNPRQCEMVNAFIISADKENIALNQVELLKKVDSSGKTIIPSEISNSGELIEKNFQEIYAKMNQLLSNASVNSVKSDDDARLKAMESKMENLLSVLSNSSVNPVKSDNGERFNIIESKLEQVFSTVTTLKILVEEFIKPPGKVNLLTAEVKAIANALQEVGANTKQIKAALEAINYWKQPNKTLTWDNLRKSTKTGEHKIPNFANATYQKLENIGEIPTE